LEKEVTHFKIKGSSITSVCTPQEEIQSDEVVVASGAWSEPLFKALGIQLSVQA